MHTERALSEDLFTKFSTLVYNECGINLHDGKKALLQARLNKRLRTVGLGSYQMYYDHLMSLEGKEELLHFLDCISTNLTFFFRESQHFEFLSETVLPEIFGAGPPTNPQRVRFWSAGCSTGEEPYGLAMTVLDYVDDLPFRDFKILATDISTRVLNTAHRGLYAPSKMERVPPACRAKYFRKTMDGKGQPVWEVVPLLRKIVSFRRLNLKDPYPFKGLFHCIFCRNVMIYFDKKTQESIIQRMSQYLIPGGYLFVGHSESLTGLAHPLAYVRPAVYRKRL